MRDHSEERGTGERYRNAADDERRTRRTIP